MKLGFQFVKQRSRFVKTIKALDKQKEQIKIDYLNRYSEVQHMPCNLSSLLIPN
jgi:hypothetical protein